MEMRTLRPSLSSIPSTKPTFLSSSTQTLNTSHFANLTLERAQALATNLDSCSDLKHLTQIHTHLLRRHLLPHSQLLCNSLMRSYLRLSLPTSSLILFSQMRRFGLHPDRYSLPLALKATSFTFSITLALQLHALALKHRLDHHVYSESGLISIYSKSGEFVSARKVFDENPERKLGSWNALISGLAQAGHADEALRFFEEMRRSGLTPDEVTMVSVVSACGSLGDIGLAEQLHKCVLQVNSLGNLNLMVSNSLVDMYSKCGHTELALRVFDKMTRRNVSTWTAMITGLGTHGQERPALEFFQRMMENGVRPNHVTMLGVLTACAHGGFVKQGMEYLEKMKELYGVEPRASHYGCVVDMLGKVGRMKDAQKMAEKMPMGVNAVVCGTLLGASEMHGDVEVGEWAARNLMELDPQNDGVYVVLSNIYALVGMWREAQEVRKVMRERRVVKNPGFSFATKDF